MITLRAAIFLSYDPSLGYKIVSTQYLEFEMCLASHLGWIFKTFCGGGWFIRDGRACLKLEKQPFICLFISLTALLKNSVKDTWNQWKGHPIFHTQPYLRLFSKNFVYIGTVVKCDERNHGNWGGLIGYRGFLKEGEACYFLLIELNFEPLFLRVPNQKVFKRSQQSSTAGNYTTSIVSPTYVQGGLRQKITISLLFVWWLSAWIRVRHP